MRFLLTSLLFLGAVMNLSAETFVYVSMAPEQSIQIYKLDEKDGKLAPVERVTVDGAPGSLAVDPAKKFLFASLRSTSKLASFKIDPATGKLKPLSTTPLDKRDNAAFVGTDRTGKYLISASYSGGKVFVHKIGEDGSLPSAPLQTVTTTMTAHSFATDRDNRWVFVPHVSPNAVYQFRLDPATGKLTEGDKADGGKDKAGPRHIAIHPTQNLAFTSDEVGNYITAYRLDPEKGLKAYQTLSTLPADYTMRNTTAEVKISPNGKFVYVSNRGHDSIAGFEIGAEGKLTALGQTPTEKTPRSFEFSPDGKFLFGAGEGTGKLAIFQVGANGSLTRTQTVDIGKSLTWVMAVKLP